MRWVLFATACVACASCRPKATTAAELPALPLADFAITFREAMRVAGGSYTLDIKPDNTLVCTHDGVTGKTKVADYELSTLEAIVRTREFRDAAKPSGVEMGDTPTYDIHVTSKAVNVDANGYVLTASDYTTPAPMKAAIAELERLCSLPKVKGVETFDVVYTFTEQGGTAGKHEIDEVRSDATAERRDLARVLQAGAVDPLDLAPLGRLLASPELAALGASFTDEPPTPPMPEVDYVVEISKKTMLSGTFYEKTPPIVVAISAEVSRVAKAAKPR